MGHVKLDIDHARQPPPGTAVIVVDTSVWVSVLRSPGSPETPFLVDLP